ncbi:hypothetical protein [Halorubrum aidingense]|uniref:hypothetical protein n=1 Tax=Halorubrum aidingense TaxID=368623 RepID=UPI00126705EF|nr:hypothetical protein [Halorubrum aidingense]
MPSKDPIPLDEGRLEYLLELQHQRYYHLQTLARGILGSVISIGAVLATLVAAFYDLFPGISVSLEEYGEVASSVGVPSVRVQAIFLLNSIIVYIFLWLIVISFKEIVIKLSEVVLGRSLLPQSSRQSDYVTESNWGVMNNTYTIFLYSSFQANREIIDEAYDRLIAGGLRIGVFVILLTTASFLYINISEKNLIQVLTYNSIIIVLTVFPAFGRVVFGIDSLGGRERSSTLTQELFEENNPDSRWSKVTTGKWESRLIIIIVGLTLISFLIYLLTLAGV